VHGVNGLAALNVSMVLCQIIRRSPVATLHGLKDLRSAPVPLLEGACLTKNSATPCMAWLRRLLGGLHHKKWLYGLALLHQVRRQVLALDADNGRSAAAPVQELHSVTPNCENDGMNAIF
jgi:hypothetical protein